MDKESKITINGSLLTDAQSMTIRVAFEFFALDIKINGLGNDRCGIDIAKGYLERAKEIRKYMYLDEEKHTGPWVNVPHAPDEKLD